MTKQKRYTCFLKVTDYQKKYLETRYGSPVCFPSCSMIQLMLRRYLVRNASMKRITDFSFSSSAFSYEPSGTMFLSEYQSLTDEEKKSFIEMELPEEVLYGNKAVRVDQFFQLSASGARRIRNEIKNEFWLAFSSFRDDCLFRAARIGETLTTEDIMSDFMNVYDIDMKSYDSLMRNWWRVKPKIKDRIEGKRDELEEKSGNVFIYT